jgi:hypothetical protein
MYYDEIGTELGVVFNRYAFIPLENISNDKDQESIWVNLFLPKTKPIQIGLCYRPPSQTNFTEVFEQSLQMLRSDCETYILGDFNIDFKPSNKTSIFKSYRDLLNLFDLNQIIEEPTRVTDSSSTVIDHIIKTFLSVEPYLLDSVTTLLYSVQGGSRKVTLNHISLSPYVH